MSIHLVLDSFTLTSTRIWQRKSWSMIICQFSWIFSSQPFKTPCYFLARLVMASLHNRLVCLITEIHYSVLSDASSNPWFLEGFLSGLACAGMTHVQQMFNLNVTVCVTWQLPSAVPGPASPPKSVCVYYCRCLLLQMQDLVQSCLRGQGGDIGGHDRFSELQQPEKSSSRRASARKNTPFSALRP